MTKMLVTGATGISGRHGCKQLIERGHQVRALAHKEDDRSRALQQLGIEVVYGDLLSGRSPMNIETLVKQYRSDFVPA